MTPNDHSRIVNECLSSSMIKPIAGSTSIDYPKSLNQEKNPYLRNSASMRRSCEPLIKGQLYCRSLHFYCKLLLSFYSPLVMNFTCYSFIPSLSFSFCWCHTDFIYQGLFFYLSLFIMYLSSLLTSCTSLVVTLF